MFPGYSGDAALQQPASDDDSGEIPQARLAGRESSRHPLQYLDAPGKRAPLGIGERAQPRDERADPALAAGVEQLDALRRGGDLDAAAVAGLGDAGDEAALDQRVDDPAHRRRLDL